jgi:hypothetical protein
MQAIPLSTLLLLVIALELAAILIWGTGLA